MFAEFLCGQFLAFGFLLRCSRTAYPFILMERFSTRLNFPAQLFLNVSYKSPILIIPHSALTANRAAKATD